MTKQIIPTLAGLIILFVLGWYIDKIAHAEIVRAVNFTIYATAFATALLVTLGLVFAGLLVRERFLSERAGRRHAETQANVMVVKAEEGQQVFIRETDQKVTWRNAHLDSRIYANGQSTLPSPVELLAWQTWTLRNRPNVINTPIPQLLPGTIQADLLAELDNVQRCLIVGASDSGKTTLLQNIVSRRLINSKVVVIDPHAYPEKWPNCIVVGTGRNYQEIDIALNALVRLMTKRYGDIGKGLVVEGNHPKLTIIIDEWRAIVFNVKKASEAIKALLTESRKAAFSVFVATHSERVKALGIEGEGDLKDGFAIVRLSNINGQRQASIDKGNGQIQTTLPYRPQVIESDDFINLEMEPDQLEAKIIRLRAEGASYNEIARQVFGNTGGKQTEKIREILERFNQD